MKSPPEKTPLTTQLTSFPPVVDDKTTVLILGSFPGKASLDAEEYYAHPRNQFWRLLSEVLNDPLVNLEYKTKLRQLQRHGLGVWDVLSACHREGSLDSAIRNPRANDFDVLKHQCPLLKRVCFNGKTSGKFEQKFKEAGFDTLLLPSSSPAYALMSFDEKLTVWRGIMQ